MNQGRVEGWRNYAYIKPKYAGRIEDIEDTYGEIKRGNISNIMYENITQWFKEKDVTIERTATGKCMYKNIVFDLGNVLLKGSPLIVLENLNILGEICQNIKNKFFNNWEYLDLGEESIKQHFDNCNFDFNIDESVRDIVLNNNIDELISSMKDNNIIL